MARAGHPRSPRTGLILIASGAVVVSQGYGACRSEVPGLRRDSPGLWWPKEELSMDVRCLSDRFTS